MCIWKVAVEDRKCPYCLMTHCEERVRKNARRCGRVMTKVRAMGRGHELVFEPEFHNALRTAIHRMRHDFGFAYVTKVDECGIHVWRIK